MSTDHQNHDNNEDHSLATLLSVEQRGELSVLIATTTEVMRDDLRSVFELQGDKDEAGLMKMEPKSIDDQVSRLSVQDDKGTELEKEEMLRERERERQDAHADAAAVSVSATELQELQTAAIDYFDVWRDSVILRVGEVVNARDHAHQDKVQGHARRVSQAGERRKSEIKHPDKHDKAVNEALSKIYPPRPTPLASLSHGERSTILNAVLLLLLSLESYKAHSRTLLLRLASSLRIPSAEVTMMEKDVAYGLLTAASQMDGSSSATAAQKANATARKWKVGLASVAGAALIGVTGGLAAPLVAAGVGGLMGGLGLGATAAAGYLGALAGSGVLVGGLFGAYGGKMTGQMMDAYAREVQDFAFVPVHGVELEHNEELAKAKRRLRVTVGVSGWLTKEEATVSPWKVLGDGGEPFALRFELKALMALGNALENFVKSFAWGYIKKELIARTVLAGLWTALMLPIGILKVSRIVDNPFSVAKARADKAGEVLADALINKAQGERPVSLIGYSLGARVIYSCLMCLSQRKAFGLVDSVVIMGSPTPSDAEDWRALRSIVSGRLINVFSANDYVLAYLYRASSVQLGIAGLQAVQGVPGVENVDVGDAVSGHLRYQYMVGDLLTKVGWSDIDEEELHKEAQALQKVVVEEKELEGPQEELDDEKLEAEAAKLEKKVSGG